MELRGLHGGRPGAIHLPVSLLPAPALRAKPQESATPLLKHPFPVQLVCSAEGGGCLGDLADRTGAAGGGELPGHHCSAATAWGELHLYLVLCYQ